MRFHVTTLRRAEIDCNGILAYIAERSKAGAVAWVRAYDAAVERLEQSADTFPLAPESEHVDLSYGKCCSRRGADVFIARCLQSAVATYSFCTSAGRDRISLAPRISSPERDRTDEFRGI